MLNTDRIAILCNEFKRSADSLRKRRSLPEYKALVKAALEKLRTTPIVQPNVDQHITPVVQHATPTVHPELTDENNTVNILVHNPVQKRVTFLWSVEEETHMAHKEASLIKEGITGTEINDLLSQDSRRSKESIRKRRCLAAYKLLVQEKLRELDQELIQDTIIRNIMEIQGTSSRIQSVDQSASQAFRDYPNVDHTHIAQEPQNPTRVRSGNDQAELNLQEIESDNQSVMQTHTHGTRIPQGSYLRMIKRN